MATKISKPKAGQSPSWADVYLEKIPDGEVMEYLDSGADLMLEYVENLTDEQLLYSYAENKWTIKEVLVHIMDAERVFNYRALTAARQDTTPLPGFDHNAYVPKSGANQRSKESLLAEYKALRQATVLFFASLDEEALDFIGEAKGQPCTARAMAYMTAGHERHHLQILKERYNC